MTTKTRWFLLIAPVLILAAGWMWKHGKPASEFYVQPSQADAQVEDSSIATSAPASTPRSVTAVTTVSPEEMTADQKIKILDEILTSRNDNDPRLDTVFRNLSDEDKEKLQHDYANQPKEKLNERGTVVFLLGRELSDYKDLAFIRSVAEEAPCMDFTNCNRTDPAPTDDHAGIDQISLVYPQVNALKALEKFIATGGRDPQMIRAAQSVLENARRSQNQIISQMAAQILNKP